MFSWKKSRFVESDWCRGIRQVEHPLSGHLGHEVREAIILLSLGKLPFLQPHSFSAGKKFNVFLWPLFFYSNVFCVHFEMNCGWTTLYIVKLEKTLLECWSHFNWMFTHYQSSTSVPKVRLQVWVSYQIHNSANWAMYCKHYLFLRFLNTSQLLMIEELWSPFWAPSRLLTFDSYPLGEL